MNRLISVPLLLLLLVSCQEDLLYRNNKTTCTPEDSSFIINDEPQTKVETLLIDEPFVYLSETDFDRWSHIVGLENRFDACDIPESQLRMMTTEALVKSILHYPLNYLYCFYNDPFQAIDIIMERSALHKEYVKRQDAAKVILDSFENTVMSFEEKVVSKDYKTLSYVDEMFLEYFLASKFINGLSQPEIKERLRMIVERKVEERLKDDGYNSIEPLARINEKHNLGINNIAYSAINKTLRSTIIYTYCGQILNGDNYSELSPKQIAIKDSIAVLEHPSATLISSSSALYNCHSYAWYNNDISSNNVWLERYYNGNFQLQRYWTNDLYEGCNETEAEKVYYHLGNHSAVRLNSSNYVSKWGDGPLMQHSPSDCPYGYPTNYFKAKTGYPMPNIPISGNTIVYADEANNYIGSYFINRPFTYVWSVDYWYDQTTPFSLQQLVPDEYQLTCYEYGVYTIRIDAYFNGNNIAYGELNVNCIPDF